MKIGQLVLGTKGSVEGRKGTVVVVEGDKVYVWMETGEVVKNVPVAALKGRPGRPKNIHSLIAYHAVEYSESAPLTSAELWDGTCGVLPPFSALDPATLAEEVRLSNEIIDEVIAEEKQAQVKPRIRLVGADGNAFFLIGHAMSVAKKAGWTKDRIDAFREEATSGDYDNVLATIAKHFDIVDDVEE